MHQPIYVPSKHAGSDSHPVRIGWEALARSGPDDSCTLACFRTGSVWLKPATVSQNQIGSGLDLHKIIRAVCGRTQTNLKEKGGGGGLEGGRGREVERERERERGERGGKRGGQEGGRGR